MEAFPRSFNTPFIPFCSFSALVAQAVVRWAAVLDLFCLLVIALLLGHLMG